MKGRHTAALELTKLLAKLDTTWENSFIVEDKTISLGKSDCNLDDDAIKKEGEQSNSTTEGGKGGGGSYGRNRTINYDTPLLIAASEGIREIFDEILRVHPQAIEHVTY
jgi:hypothetical protein